MALNTKQLTSNMLSQRTFNQVSHFGIFCGEVEYNKKMDIWAKEGHHGEYVAVRKQFYYYLGRLWHFTLINQEWRGRRPGDLTAAGWHVVEDNQNPTPKQIKALAIGSRLRIGGRTWIFEGVKNRVSFYGRLAGVAPGHQNSTFTIKYSDVTEII